MPLRERLLDDLKSAMKARETQRLNVLRMLKAKVQEAEVGLRTSKGLGYQLDDDETLKVLATYAKQRRESVEAYRSGGREDLAAQEEAELRIVEAYLPQQASEEQVRIAVEQAIVATGATSKKDLGAVVKAAMTALRGAADGKLIHRIALERLGG